MSDTSATGSATPRAGGTQPGDAGPAGEAAAASRAGEPAKPPERPVSEIRADIEKERVELRGSFERLRGELDEAVDEGERRAGDAGRKTKKVAPIVAGAVVSLLVARSLLKRRSRR